MGMDVCRPSLAPFKVETRPWMGSFPLAGDSVSIVIPEEDRRLIERVLIAEHAERRGTEHVETRIRRRYAEPASSEDAEKVAVAKHDDASAGFFEASHDAVCPGRDGLDGLAPGTAVAKQVPPRCSARISAVVRPSYAP